MASSRIDIVIYGATGFTGKAAVFEILKLVKEKNITWAVAGRSESKLKEMLSEISTKTGENLDHVPVIVADVEDEKSLNAMAAKVKVVVNCVGPFRFYGEPVVKACVENGASHVDVSGEPQYMEEMQLKYNKAAEEKGVYIVSACGYDSIPSEIGLIHFIEQFKGEVNSVEAYYGFSTSGPVEGAVVNSGTWKSLIHGMQHATDMRPLREKLYPEKLPTFLPKLRSRSAVHKNEVINQWCLPFLGADRSVMYRSQRFFYEHNKTRPVQVQTYIGFASLLQTLLLVFFGSLIAMLSKVSFTRKLLLEHPKFFSGGFASNEGPNEESRNNTIFTITFSGEGWTEHASEGVNHSTPPNKTMITKVSGRDPGYGFTTTALLLCANTIVKENDKMPGTGGVLPPGAAFAKTSLMKDLSAHGLKFEVIEETTITDKTS